MAFGAAINGRASAVFFKSVGLNVAADSFVQLALMDIPGGLVLILGDDPGAWNYIPLAAVVHPLKRRALARLEEFRSAFEGAGPERGFVGAPGPGGAGTPP
jgi:hypothetical protein